MPQGVPLGSTRKIQLDKQGSATVILGTGSIGDTSCFLVHIVNTSSLSTSIVVAARAAVREAMLDGDDTPFLATLYRPLFLNGSVASGGGALVSTAITGSSLIVIPATGMEIALVQTYVSGTGVAYVTQLIGSSVL
jgi:hypothetical protein